MCRAASAFQPRIHRQGLRSELETGRSWANVGAKKMRGITSTSNRDLFNGCHPPIVHAHGDEIKLMWRFRALMYETVPQTEVEFYIPGNFIPASLRAKLALPICLNILRICAYWRSRLFTSCTLVPDPRAMRFRRLPLMTSW